MKRITITVAITFLFVFSVGVSFCIAQSGAGLLLPYEAFEPSGIIKSINVENKFLIIENEKNGWQARLIIKENTEISLGMGQNAKAVTISDLKIGDNVKSSCVDNMSIFTKSSVCEVNNIAVYPVSQ
jgi:hypothetical protein